MRQQKKDFCQEYKVFADKELNAEAIQLMQRSSTCMVLGCTFFSGAAELLAKHLGSETASWRAEIERFFEQELHVDTASSHHWFSTCWRLAQKYPVIKEAYLAGATALANWLKSSGLASSELVSLLKQYEKLSLLELRIEQKDLPKTMDERQRAEFNAQFYQVTQRRLRRRRIVYWLLFILAVIGVVFIGGYYGAWDIGLSAWMN